MALVMAAGMGRPIRPAFSTMEMASLAEKPMIAASRTKLPPMILHFLHYSTFYI